MSSAKRVYLDYRIPKNSGVALLISTMSKSVPAIHVNSSSWKMAPTFAECIHKTHSPWKVSTKLKEFLADSLR